jgi:2,4-dienoyl-CoA reductase-like NADH-dependent reductase (Old Yellow Enzyme family)
VKNRISPKLKRRFGGVLIANEGYSCETAQQVLAAGEADAASFGKDFISNPVLPRRLQLNADLNPFHTETFYGYGLQVPAAGYTDYPYLAAEFA